MNWTTCLAGLPEDTSAWNSLLLMRYLLLLGLLDCASGQVAVRLAVNLKYSICPETDIEIGAAPYYNVRVSMSCP